MKKAADGEGKHQEFSFSQAQSDWVSVKRGGAKRGSNGGGGGGEEGEDEGRDANDSEDGSGADAADEDVPAPVEQSAEAEAVGEGGAAGAPGADGECTPSRKTSVIPELPPPKPRHAPTSAKEAVTLFALHPHGRWDVDRTAGLDHNEHVDKSCSLVISVGADRNRCVAVLQALHKRHRELGKVKLSFAKELLGKAEALTAPVFLDARALPPDDRVLNRRQSVAGEQLVAFFNEQEAVVGSVEAEVRTEIRKVFAEKVHCSRKLQIETLPEQAIDQCERCCERTHAQGADASVYEPLQKRILNAALGKLHDFAVEAETRLGMGNMAKMMRP
jgi:hypothetical protein